jgi:hypothetical protein
MEKWIKLRQLRKPAQMVKDSCQRKAYIAPTIHGTGPKQIQKHIMNEFMITLKLVKNVRL